MTATQPSIERPASQGEYERFVALAVAEYEAGRWAEARALFLVAHGFRPNARTWRALGMTAYALRQYPDAVRELAAALVDRRDPLAPPLRQEARDLLERANAFVGCYRVRLDPAEARLRIDGAEARLERNGALLLSVGPHQLEVDADGYRQAGRPIFVEGRDGEVLSFRLLPALEPEGEPAAADRSRFDRFARDYRATWIAGASALALGTGSVALYMFARREDEDVERACRGECSPVEIDHGERDRLIRWSSATIALSAAATVSAVVLFFLERAHAQRGGHNPGRARRAALDLSSFRVQF